MTFLTVLVVLIVLYAVGDLLFERFITPHNKLSPKTTFTVRLLARAAITTIVILSIT